MIIDTDKVAKWAKLHLQLVLIAAFFFSSWFLAKLSSGLPGDSGMSCFYGMWAILLSLATVVLVVVYLLKVFGVELP